VTNLALLVVCLALGVLLRRSGRLPEDAPRALNGFVLNVALPALVVRHLQGLALDGQLALAALMPWVLFAAGAAFFALLGRAAGWPRETTGGLMLSGGLANTSFVGLPMIEAFYGPAFLAVGVLVDQLGTYMVLSTFGVVVAAFCSPGAVGAGGGVRAGDVAGRVLRFPPFQALVAGLLLSQVALPGAALGLLDRLAGTLVPLALVSVGLQLRLAEARGSLRELSAGLVFKLALGPALIAALLMGGLGATGRVAEVTVFEAAMGPQIGGAIVAMQHGLNPRLVTLMVGIGIPLSLLTAAAWWFALSA
jgi:malate permease and related proteins